MVDYKKVYLLNISIRRFTKRRSMTKYEEDKKIRIIEEYFDGNEDIPPRLSFLISGISVSTRLFRLLYPHKMSQVPSVLEEVKKYLNGRNGIEVVLDYFPLYLPKPILLGLLNEALLKKKARYNQIRNDPFKSEYDKQRALAMLEESLKDIQIFIEYLKKEDGLQSIQKLA
ncbi:hypothetical protein ATV_gp65 [Bicaudavirus pozzuoliense]|uniref:Uncharacterized protein ORF170 n=2 Tax=Acidianus two-tailed virus TaxID=315953 RepID=Y170_ATV|nr:hypothetical protein ATV_gp65 [Acidianus two-tailed virus]Q3V4Q2.1 RecName: Full=Uncharacterized protein ORF170 [Acidianus two-tailed virus]AON96541.1 hypothetical protein [Acidianus two-tailed phage variant 1]CAI59912.1 hypothetical protein [Acidianus two-tailed virus]